VRVLVTGGAGFIGSNFVRYMLQRHPGYEIVVLDALTYAGRLENLQDVAVKIEFIKGNICIREDVNKAIEGCDVVLNFAAESHVDRSIMDAGSFVRTDVLGTYQLLETARESRIEKFIQISTDEVYGSIQKGSFDEAAPLQPNSPYSASKAGADMLARAYFVTHGFPIVITRSSNNYGPYQYPEKLIPLFITNLISSKKVPLYGDGLNVRDWIYVSDNCSAIDLVFHRGKAGEVYNIGGGCEKTNIEIARRILQLLGKGEDSIEYVEDRKGHDRRYSLDSSKIQGLGWRPEMDFDRGIESTVEWYCRSEWWWRPLVGR